MTKRTHCWCWSISIVAVSCIILSGDGTADDTYPPCSAEVMVSTQCTEMRKCNKTVNPECLTEIFAYIPAVNKCRDHGALPADNCITLETTSHCGWRGECKKDPETNECIKGGLLGNISVHRVDDGGHCTVE